MDSIDLCGKEWKSEYFREEESYWRRLGVRVGHPLRSMHGRGGRQQDRRMHCMYFRIYNNIVMDAELAAV